MPAGEVKQIILAGSGHAHLHVCSRARDLIQAGAKVTLVAPDRYWYFANMAPEILSGYYGVKDFRVDVHALAEKNQVEFITDEVTSVLTEHKRIMTASGRALEYDWLSFAVGAVPVEREGDVPVDGSYPLYPVSQVLEIRNEVETLLELEPQKELVAVILGGGATGIETALNLTALLKERSPQAGYRVILFESKDRVLPEFPRAASRRALKKLQKQGIEVRTLAPVQHVQSGRVVLERGETLDFDLAVVASGVRAPEFFERSGLFTDEAGALVVERTLRSREYPELFASGDCARIMGLALSRLGAHAAAQGPVLLHNLLAVLQKSKIKIYTRTAPPLQIISLGSADALLISGSKVLQGRWALWVKHWLDRRYIRHLQKK